MCSSSAFPRCSLLLLAFNQQEFIKDAITHALEQDYQNLEIILSDDCSSDTTFEIILNAAKFYTGFHTVRLNQNAYNMGLAEHINKLVSMSTGDLIVLAAGDDMSMPNRISILSNAWATTNYRSISLLSQCMYLEGGQVFLPDKRPHSGGLHEIEDSGWDLMHKVSSGFLGCTQAFSKDLFSRYGNIHRLILHEDIVLETRALLADGIYYIEQPLVIYRVTAGGGGSCPRNDRDQLRYSARKLINFWQYILDRIVIISTGKRQAFSCLYLDLAMSASAASAFKSFLFKFLVILLDGASKKLSKAISAW